MSPRYSVLLPTRNGGPFLRNCIQSVLGQDERDLELVVADNANTDETGQVLAEFVDDPRFRVLRHEAPISVTDNWMSALEKSSGEYLVMLGDDDALLPSYFESIGAVLDANDAVDSIAYNGFSYVFPGSFGAGTGSYYADPHFRFDRGLREGVLSRDYRRHVVHDMYRFAVRYPLNMQLTLFSRRAIARVPEPFFRAPFPDHFAINSLLLTAGKTVYCERKLVVIGVTPKSFGHFAYAGDSADGMRYLGSTSRFDGRLDGSELLNSMYDWLELLRRAYPDQLGAERVDRAAYLRRQVAFWLVQYRQHRLSFEQSRRLLSGLSRRDWLSLAGTPFDPAIWRRASRLGGLVRRNDPAAQWPGLKPLPGVTDIAQFIAWICQSPSPPVQQTAPSSA